jgi:ribosomal protein L11 methyltransferase
MPWIEFHITTSEEYVSELSEQLTHFGAVAVTLHDGGNQPILEPTKDTPLIWKKTVVVGLFTHDIALNPILAYLEAQQSQAIIQEFSTQEVADQDWVRLSLDSFKPTSFGRRLWITPSWQTPPVPDAMNVILDPGLAFGTGTHATTALCLEWLDQHIDSQKLVIDYGTGSGILGISALKLGAEQVFAVDHDVEALHTAKENGIQNQLLPPVWMTYLPHELPQIKADLIIANILSQPLMSFASLFASLTQKGGKIVLSGILAEDAEMVLNTYRAYYIMQEPIYRDDWVLLVGTLR